jgi:hypothetical protein
MKTCNVIGCNNPVWGKGLCKAHSLKVPFKKVSKLNPRRELKEKSIYSESRDDFFMEIWKSRPHKCESCGMCLGREPRSYMFDHILEKKLYPELALLEDNIALVCLECHDNKTRGFLSDFYTEKINFVKTKFNVS